MRQKIVLWKKRAALAGYQLEKDALRAQILAERIGGYITGCSASGYMGSAELYTMRGYAARMGRFGEVQDNFKAI